MKVNRLNDLSAALKIGLPIPAPFEMTKLACCHFDQEPAELVCAEKSLVRNQ